MNLQFVIVLFLLVNIGCVEKINQKSSLKNKTDIENGVDPVNETGTEAETAGNESAQENSQEGLISPEKSGKIYTLSLSKSRLYDPLQMKERGYEASVLVKRSLSKFSNVDALLLAEGIYKPEDYLQSNVDQLVDREKMQQYFMRYKLNAERTDSLIIYTHTHGTSGNYNNSGLFVEYPDNGTDGILYWQNYAEKLISLPGKNIIVFTMSCYSGKLIEYLNLPKVKERWKLKFEAEKRNLMVISVTNSQLKSHPVLINGVKINPLTYAVKEAFNGAADGFNAEKDGKLTLGELARFVLYTTKNVAPDTNTARPMITGTFNGNFVLNLEK